MCQKCQARFVRGRVRGWLLEVSVALLRGQLFSELLHEAAVASATAQALDPSIVS